MLFDTLAGVAARAREPLTELFIFAPLLLAAGRQGAASTRARGGAGMWRRAKRGGWAERRRGGAAASGPRGSTGWHGMELVSSVPEESESV